MDQAQTYRIYEDGTHYDLMFPHNEAGIRFWIEEAISSSGNVLELACGTGAISIPMARAGCEVTGIDLSPEMLKEARRKSEAEGLKVRWVEGDMRQFELGQKFALIILAANTICHLLDLTSIESCFRCVRQHLKMGGRFIVSVFVPSQALLKRKCDDPEPFAKYASPDGDGMVVVTQTYEYEPDTQIKRIITCHKFPDRTSVEYGSLNMRMFYPQELDALLRYNGFHIMHKWGSEHREAFGSDSGQQIVVCEMVTRADAV